MEVRLLIIKHVLNASVAPPTDFPEPCHFPGFRDPQEQSTAPDPQGKSTAPDPQEQSTAPDPQAAPTQEQVTQSEPAASGIPARTGPLRRHPRQQAHLGAHRAATGARRGRLVPAAPVDPVHPRVTPQNDPLRFRTNAHALLRTCRQLRAETRDAIAHFGPPRYDICLDIHEESLIRPTWTRLPFRTSRVGTLHVTVRFRAAPDGGHARSESGVFNGETGNLALRFWSLLSQFLAVGAVPQDPGPGDTYGQPPQRCVLVDHLIIDAQTPTADDLPPGVQVSWFKTERKRWKVNELLASGQDIRTAQRTHARKYVVMHPRHLCGYVQAHVEHMIDMPNTRPLCGSFLYERVGSVRFRVDGRPIWKDNADLAARLAQLPTLRQWIWQEDTHWKEWWMRIVRWREDAGLPTVKWASWGTAADVLQLHAPLPHGKLPDEKPADGGPADGGLLAELADWRSEEEIRKGAKGDPGIQ